MDERHENGGADDRPQDREGLPGNLEHEGLRQLELVGDPGPDEGPDEAEDHGDDEAAADTPDEGPAEGAADGRDDDEDDEPRQRDGHVSHLERPGQQAGCQEAPGARIARSAAGMGKERESGPWSVVR